jgi:hypothetical protein
MLKWARANGCMWDVLTCACAAENSSLEVLKWARENQCPWDEYTCSFAAENGQLEVLNGPGHITVHGMLRRAPMLLRMVTLNC